MAEDRLRKDYDDVENLKDLIRAREERQSAFSDDVDAMEDIDTKAESIDPEQELTWPHPHRHSDVGSLDIEVELMDTPRQKDVGFDWQDSTEEMLPTDPDPSDGMGEDDRLHEISYTSAADLAGPVPSVDYSPETDTAPTEEERREFDIDGGEPEPNKIWLPLPLETAMDTDSDENDFSIEEKFAGEVDRVTALREFADLEACAEEPKDEE